MEPATTSDIASGQSRQYADQENASTLDSRYSKDKILEIYRSQQTTEPSNGAVSRLFVNNWEPGHSNGSNGRGWGKSGDTRDNNNGPDICWDQGGQVQPIGLEELTPAEREVCLVERISYIKLTLVALHFRCQLPIETTTPKSHQRPE